MQISLSLLTLSFTTTIITIKASSTISCLDETGNAVDSYVSLIQNEDYQYYYHTQNGFEKSPYLLNQTNDGSIMKTMNQLYSSSLDMDNIAYALYNDEPPPDTTASSTYAHSKGVILTDGTRGFWMVHSKPSWPNARDDGAAPFPDTKYAQSLLCMTFDVESFNTIAYSQMVNYPYVYDSHLSDSLVDVLPNFASWISKGKVDEVSMNQPLTTSGGADFTQFAKNKAWAKDLYEDLVATDLQSPLYVETWRSGSGGRMSSFCENPDDDEWETHEVPYDIFEVATVLMPDGEGWTGTQDHSKWAASTTSTDGYVCIGDINRMCSQEGRGGGTVCFKDDTIWSSFKAVITTTEMCWEYDPCTGDSTQCYWCES